MDEPTIAFNDATCTKCGAGIHWRGKLGDRPTCSKCGHKMEVDPEEAAAVERMVEQARQQALND